MQMRCRQSSGPIFTEESILGRGSSYGEDIVHTSKWLASFVYCHLLTCLLCPLDHELLQRGHSLLLLPDLCIIEVT
jgi:hypothetical protein